MLDALFGRKRELRDAADRLYVALVEQARAPWFYADLEAPDTVDGRFDLIALHVWAAHRALVAGAAPAPELAQRLVDTMFTDMDRGLRELGVGDHGVARRLKQMVGAFRGRVAAYEAASDREAMAAALSRNVYRSESPVPQADEFAGYALELARRLEAAPIADLIAARPPAAPAREDL
ncbi:MAG: ubiquinol-cytochrome C chaperone family protein [Alphaproteobacteria bacterium]